MHIIVMKRYYLWKKKQVMFDLARAECLGSDLSRTIAPIFLSLKLVQASINLSLFGENKPIWRYKQVNKQLVDNKGVILKASLLIHVKCLCWPLDAKSVSTWSLKMQRNNRIWKMKMLTLPSVVAIFTHNLRIIWIICVKWLCNSLNYRGVICSLETVHLYSKLRQN